MFARAARKPGTPAYEQYYAAHPQLRAIDDRIRSATPFLEPGGQYYDERIIPEARKVFASIQQLEADPNFLCTWLGRLQDTDQPAELIRQMLTSLGAVAVGVAPLEQSIVYSHAGRSDEDYGREINLPHTVAIVFLVEMDLAAMQCAPAAEVLHESARQYYRAAIMAKNLAAVLQAAGWSAKAHHDAHYEVILPALAVLAGLGELGRNNILVADRYGSRVRIGAVTTDLQLPLDSPIDLGVQHFCVRCKKCATNCPSRALSEGDKVFERGVLKWPTAAHRCYGYWRWLGTDCGICMSVCPFSHRDTKFHNLVRLTVRHVHRSHGLALWFDDLIYGPKWQGPPTR